MAIPMYQIAIPDLLRAMRNLAHILAKGSDHATTHKIDPSVLINSRLFPDMFPLVKQVQIATDVAKACAARLASMEVPKYEDNETTFEALQARIEKVTGFLNSFTPAQIDGSENKEITFKSGGNQLNLKAMDYLLQYVKPNVYFHISTTYALLRHNGVTLGKRDFLGAL